MSPPTDLDTNDNVQLLDREATLLGTGKCPLYNYDSGMNRATRHQAWLLLLLGSHRCLFYMFIISIEHLFMKYNTHYTAFHGQNNFA